MISVFQLFRIGIGPSSSHTVGPMRAAKWFRDTIEDISLVSVIQVHLYGSLALTGVGHHTDRAIILGLLGQEPETISPDDVDLLVDQVRATGQLNLKSDHSIPFTDKTIRFHKRKRLPLHSNGMRFEAFDSLGQPLLEKEYYSVGGGFVSESDKAEQEEKRLVPYPFTSASDLLGLCKKENKSIHEIMWANECWDQTESEIDLQLTKLWDAMTQSIDKGCRTRGVLPGGLNVKRRAPDLYERIMADTSSDPMVVMDWVSLFALAVNEENAAGGRVVTAPTNGSAGIIPSILRYFNQFQRPLNREELIVFFMTAGAIGILYKTNASLSGAEMGCQGEVGVACSMAAGGLAALQGGNINQVENAAEIGMEHHLGLTCDPVKGLVQIPCIERNTMGAVKAINAARLALSGDGDQKVSLDKVIRTMKQTGDDMKHRYKETSQGGLAINVIEC
ncbi:L-serine ammonia-lyase [bacterium]|jgi:L-serine dehydratase|nr:L-serine ammonia-lyase [bacterium]